MTPDTQSGGQFTAPEHPDETPVYEEEEDWSKAAKMLAGIPLDSGIRVLDDNYKVEKYIQIAMLYLQERLALLPSFTCTDEESVSAETFINRASLLIGESTEPALKLQHKVRHARTREDTHSHALLSWCRPSRLPLGTRDGPSLVVRVPRICVPRMFHETSARRPRSVPAAWKKTPDTPVQNSASNRLGGRVVGVLRAHPRFEAQVPRGGHALLPPVAAAEPAGQRSRPNVEFEMRAIELSQRIDSRVSASEQHCSARLGDAKDEQEGVAPPYPRDFNLANAMLS
eukprot:3849274-Pleurochrysis_carterae.AAC.1